MSLESLGRGSGMSTAGSTGTILEEEEDDDTDDEEERMLCDEALDIRG